LASKRPRLLLDESITGPLASLIIGLVPSAILSTQTLGQGAKDPIIAAFANSERRTIVAIDSDFRKYQVEQGVIKISGPDRADDHCLYQIFYSFWTSGFRGKSQTRRTFLTREGLRIQNGEAIVGRWHPKPCTSVRGAVRLISAPSRKKRAIRQGPGCAIEDSALLLT
jgi:hypothetical protein